MPAPTLEPDDLTSFTVAAGVDLHVRCWKAGGEPPVVLVHGLASNARLWDGVAAELAAAGHPVVAYDQRGHGRSSKPAVAPGTYSMRAVVQDLAAVVDQAGFERPVVVGQSWGGNVAVELAATLPGVAAAVVGIDGGAIELAERFPDWEACADALTPPPLTGALLTEIEARLRGMHPDWPESGIQGTLANFEVRDDGTVAPWLTLDRHLAVLRGLWEHRPSDRWADIGDPVVLVGAEPPEDQGAATRQRARRASLVRAADRLRHGRTVWMRGDHDLHAQHPRNVAALIGEVAAEMTPTS